MEEFKIWIEQKGMKFPVPEKRFDDLMQQFAIYNEESDTKTRGRKDLSRHNLGFVDGKLRYFRISFKAEGVAF
jgi:hypothetical protein